MLRNALFVTAVAVVVAACRFDSGVIRHAVLPPAPQVGALSRPPQLRGQAALRRSPVGRRCPVVICQRSQRPALPLLARPVFCLPWVVARAAPRPCMAVWPCQLTA